MVGMSEFSQKTMSNSMICAVKVLPAFMARLQGDSPWKLHRNGKKDFKSAPNKNQLQAAWIRDFNLKPIELTGHFWILL
jgi:hypothetical protein